MSEYETIRNLILKAREVLKSVVHETPLTHSTFFSNITGKTVYLKLENLQKTGSFKVRGAYFKIYSLLPDVKVKGVVTASSGNHAQGVAYSAKELGIKSTIVMPETTPPYKVNAVKSYGSEVILHGRIYDDAYAKALEISESSGAYLIHPFDDPYVIAGQGTIGLEIFEQLPDVDTVLVPIGGGGLISGIALALKSRLGNKVKIIGVEPKNASKTRESLIKGSPVRISPNTSIADGVLTKGLGSLTFKIIRDFVDDVVEVDEDSIARAMYLLLERTKLLVEGAGALPIAALLSYKDEVPGKNVVAVLSGGNADLTILYRIILRGLMIDGRIAKVVMNLRDVPGSLERALKIIAEFRCNILDVTHERLDLDVEPGYARVKVLMELPDRNVYQELIKKLLESGIKVIT